MLTSRADQAAAARTALNVASDQVKQLEKDQADMEKMDASLKDAAKDALIVSLKGIQIAGYSDGLDHTVSLKKEGDRIISEELNQIAPKFTAALVSVRKSVTDFQSGLEVRMSAEQKQNEAFVMGGAGLCCLLGLVVAFTITRGITLARLGPLPPASPTESSQTNSGCHAGRRSK